MRIAIVQAGLGAGGAEKNIAMIARHRAKMGDEVHVIAMSCPEEGPYFAKPDSVKVHVLENVDARPGPLLQFQRILRIRRCLRSIKPDIILSFLTKINVLTIVANTGLGHPIAVSERNNPWVQGGSRLWPHLANLASLRANSLVMLTNRARDHLPKLLKSRAVVIPNPCKAIAKVEPGPSSGNRIVAVGRLDYQKGFDLLIGAFAKVHATHAEATLTIHGEGQERKRLEALVAKNGLSGVVSLPGTTKSPGIWANSADIFVLSSRYEGFCNALAEATASGLPSVAFDCDYGPSEIIENEVSGLLVTLGDVDGLAAAMGRLIKDHALRSRLSQAAIESSGKFTQECILASWDSVVEGLASAKR